jgi:hypothetical protein
VSQRKSKPSTNALAETSSNLLVLSGLDSQETGQSNPNHLNPNVCATGQREAKHTKPTTLQVTNYRSGDVKYVNA